MKHSKRIAVEFGCSEVVLHVPAGTDLLSMADTPVIPSPAAALEQALDQPIGAPPLAEIVGRLGRPEDKKVVIAVSDITRPVPYKGDDGILPPLLGRLEKAGILRENITLLVATGTHRASTPGEKLDIFGPQVVDRYRIEDHDCEDRESLVPLGPTRSGTEVFLNRTFNDADLRIVTGLVESHFMTGFSGGRKSVCPGLVDRKTIERFHGPDILEHPLADNLVLEGNPCHEESLEVALTVGVDFTVNVTLDRRFRITGIYGGGLREAHEAACADVSEALSIPIAHPYDVVVTHAGYVGRNHYQTAKAACAADPAVRPEGTLIILADNYDPEPIGGPEYRTLLHLLKLQGPDGYVAMLRNPSWRFTGDQWEPEMWGRVLRKLGPERMIYCGPAIPAADYALIPGVPGHAFLEGPAPTSPREAAERMVQGALDRACRGFAAQVGREPEVAVILDGPYGIPVLSV